MTDLNVIEIIESKYDSLFPSEKKVANYILNNTSDVISMNIAELAKKANTSDATVVRAIQHLGFDGYYQLRLLLSKDLGKSESQVETDDALSNVQKFFTLESERITRLAKTIDFKDLITISNIILESKRVHIVAVGNTSPVASDLGFRLQRAGIVCDYSQQFEQYINNINLGTKKDCVIAFSRSGASTQVLRAVELAKKINMKIIAITGEQSSILAKQSDYVIQLTELKNQLSPIYNPESHLLEMAINDALIYTIRSIQKVNKSNATDLEEKRDKIGILLSEFKKQ